MVLEIVISTFYLIGAAAEGFVRAAFRAVPHPSDLLGSERKQDADKAVSKDDDAALRHAAHTASEDPEGPKMSVKTGDAIFAEAQFLHDTVGPKSEKISVEPPRSPHTVETRFRQSVEPKEETKVLTFAEEAALVMEEAEARFAEEEPGRRFEERDFDPQWPGEIMSKEDYYDFIREYAGTPVPKCKLNKEELEELEAEGGTWERYVLARRLVNWD